MKKGLILLLLVGGILMWDIKGVMAVEGQGSNGDGSVVILGASYAAGWPIKEIGGKAVINRGIGGHQSHEMLARIEAVLAEEGVRTILLWGFINDIFRSDRAKIEQTLAGTRENFRQMIAQARAAGIDVMLATEVTISEPERGLIDELKAMVKNAMGKTSYQDYVNGNVREVNEWLRKFALDEDIRLLEFEKTLSNEEGYRKREFSQEDGSHLTAAAYDALTVYIRQAL